MSDEIKLYCLQLDLNVRLSLIITTLEFTKKFNNILNLIVYVSKALLVELEKR